MRKTHGPNEGFDKETGRAALPLFVEFWSAGLLNRLPRAPAPPHASGCAGGMAGVCFLRCLFVTTNVLK